MKPQFLPLFVLWIVLFIAPAQLRADGGFIPRTAFAKVQIPDQRALIHYTAGTETLVIDTSFKGEGTNFAWVIPVPSKPEVKAASPGLFATLQMQFRPEVVHRVIAYWKGLSVFGVWLGVSIWLWRRGHGLAVALGTVALLLFGTLLLPALGTAKAGSQTTAEVAVLARKTVGIYDTATLASTNAAALLKWLAENGFDAPTNHLPTIQEYARDGWVFVASKVNATGPTQEPLKAHPLALTFKTEKPVYPLKLTRVGNEQCLIDLYVFGPDRAEVPGFKVERCTELVYPLDGESRSTFAHRALPVCHPDLRSITFRSPIATKLTGKLTNEEMRNDAFIRWVPYAEQRPVFYSKDAAGIIGKNWTAALLVSAGLLVILARGKTPCVPRRWGTIALALMISILGVGPLIYVCLPKVEVRTERMPGARNKNKHQTIAMSLRLRAATVTTNSAPNLESFRQVLHPSSDLWKISSLLHSNYFTGQPIREEDSPGNYTLRNGPAGLEYVWYDLDGTPNIEPLFEPSARKK